MAWIQIGKGRLDVRGRPGRKYWEGATQSGVTHVVTLLSEHEGAQEVGTQAKNAGMNWTWIPLEGADPANIKDADSLRAQLTDLTSGLQNGDSVVVHCAAGIHRTGMIAYALLRLSGESPDSARQRLMDMRSETANGVTEARLSWVDQLVDGSSPTEMKEG